MVQRYHGDDQRRVDSFQSRIGDHRRAVVGYRSGTGVRVIEGQICQDTSLDLQSIARARDGITTMEGNPVGRGEDSVHRIHDAERVVASIAAEGNTENILKYDSRPHDWASIRTLQILGQLIGNIIYAMGRYLQKIVIGRTEYDKMPIEVAKSEGRFISRCHMATDKSN